jgi:hypothetical protein
MMTTEAIARDKRPPQLLVDILNPVLRVVLRTPLGKLVQPFALLDFVGRRGRRFRIPVGWHLTDAGPVVVTPAPWRTNFRNSIPVAVHHGGHSLPYIATLDDDPERVASTLQSIADRRGTLRAIGVETPAGHRITAADVTAVNRAVIRFS